MDAGDRGRRDVSEPGAQTEALFYHLTRRPLDSVLPELLERSLARGWRVLVRSGVPERLAALNDYLWTYRDDAFLPHGDPSDGHADRQPIYLTTGPEKPNAPDVMMTIDRAAVAPDEFTAHRRLVVIFDGHDTEAVAEARDLWRQAAASACRAQYWVQDDSGRWVKKAESG
jgi:DNA polymerase-3 subunit chi